MKKFIFAFVFLLVLTFATNAQTQVSQSSDEQPKVVKAVAPNKYPSAAFVTRAQGTVVVKIQIDKIGNVESAQLVTGHKLFKADSETTAKKWKFNSIENKSKRVVQLNFIYKLVFEQGEDSEISFSAPFEVQFKYKVPDVINPSVN